MEGCGCISAKVVGQTASWPWHAATSGVPGRVAPRGLREAAVRGDALPAPQPGPGAAGGAAGARPCQAHHCTAGAAAPLLPAGVPSLSCWQAMCADKCSAPEACSRGRTGSCSAAQCIACQWQRSCQHQSCTASDEQLSTMQEPLPGPNAFKYGGKTVSAYPRYEIQLCASWGLPYPPLRRRHQCALGSLPVPSAETTARTAGGRSMI